VQHLKLVSFYAVGLARPRRFELVTLGLEMQGIEYTNDLVLHRFVCLQYLFYKVPTKMA